MCRFLLNIAKTWTDTLLPPPLGIEKTLEEYILQTKPVITCQYDFTTVKIIFFEWFKIWEQKKNYEEVKSKVICERKNFAILE